MLKLNRCVDRYHEAVAARQVLAASEFAKQCSTKVYLSRFQAYLDLSNYPQSELLVDLTEEDKAELKVWGRDYQQQLNSYYAKCYELDQERFEALCAGLKALGEMAGMAFHQTSGPLDGRINALLARADRLRKELLDGLGYVCVWDDKSQFAGPFFKHSGLSRRSMQEDMKAATEVRQGLRSVSAAEYARLGFVGEVNDESR